MPDTDFDLATWAKRIGLSGRRQPDLATLRAIVSAQGMTIPFENLDVLLGRMPRLDPESLQRKLVTERRGGYCFELNSLLYAALTAIGFQVTRLIARVIVGLDADSPRPATHMVLRVDLPEGPFLADVGFGNLTPTAPLRLEPDIEQATPHEPMRLVPAGADLVLQAKLGEAWKNIYRLAPEPKLPIDFEVANWFTATHPASPFVSNAVASRPGPGGTRITVFNGRLTIRRPGAETERRMFDDEEDWLVSLAGLFGLPLPAEDVRETLAVLARHGTLGAVHPFFD